MADGDHIVCDEYYPNDYGRIHMLGDSCYAHFYMDVFTVEYKKVVRDVAAVVYSQTDWPSSLAGSKDRETILAHFGIPHVS
jgi:hypothetical protein